GATSVLSGIGVALPAPVVTVSYSTSATRALVSTIACSGATVAGAMACGASACSTGVVNACVVNGCVVNAAVVGSCAIADGSDASSSHPPCITNMPASTAAANPVLAYAIQRGNCGKCQRLYPLSAIAIFTCRGKTID